MSLMAAGVPIKSMVAGISCGLVTGDTDDDFLVLTDIQGLEDFFGDMDFKVTGTHKGITAIQMDIKIHGLTRPIVEEAIARTREARLYIMDEVMSKAIAEPRKEVNEWAPKIEQITIDPSKIGDVVGQKGKTINEIIDRTGVKIDITDDGAVSVCGTDKEMIAKAIDMIKIITTDFEQGQILEGTVVSIKEFGAFIEFAPGKEGMVHISKIAKERINRVEDAVSYTHLDVYKRQVYDLFIACDCSDTGRLGSAAKYFESAKRTLCIDHHVTNGAFADANYIFPDASSTCELVFELLPKERITIQIAECIYTGMVHDTGVFQYSCTSKKTMDIAGSLMEMGIDYSRIIDDTFYTKTFAQNKIMGQALLNAALYLNGDVILSAVSRAEMEKYNVLPKHLDGIVNQLRVTKDIKVAVFLYENEDGTYKGSLRVNGDYDVAKVASVFGGGGHVKAAGFTIEGPLEVATDRILTAIKDNI